MSALIAFFLGIPVGVYLGALLICLVIYAKWWDRKYDNRNKGD